MQASCGGFFFGGVWALGAGTSAVVVHRFTCSVVCGIFLDWDRTCASCIGRWILYHWATREALIYILLVAVFELHQPSWVALIVCMAHKPENSYCLALYRKTLPTSGHLAQSLQGPCRGIVRMTQEQYLRQALSPPSAYCGCCPQIPLPWHWWPLPQWGRLAMTSLFPSLQILGSQLSQDSPGHLAPKLGLLFGIWKDGLVPHGPHTIRPVPKILILKNKTISLTT